MQLGYEAASTKMGLFLWAYFETISVTSPVMPTVAEGLSINWRLPLGINTVCEGCLHMKIGDQTKGYGRKI